MSEDLFICFQHPAAQDPVPDLHAAAGRAMEAIVVIQEEEMITGEMGRTLLMWIIGRMDRCCWREERQMEPGHAVPLLSSSVDSICTNISSSVVYKFTDTTHEDINTCMVSMCSGTRSF